mgnify:FL=1|tara:strand:- start:83 stop:670 length:588 start_codon:yes stop_codon:yes gene_type:complete
MGKADDILNISQGNKLAWIGDGKPEKRQKDDFYPTPPEATYSLLDKEQFTGEIWECACGNGAISNILKEKNYNVYSSDLIDRGYGDTGIDFLKTYRKTDNIITNPPFKLGTEFVYQACHLANKKVAMLCRINFLEGVARGKMFKNTPLKTVYVFSRRITFTNPDTNKKSHGGGMLAFAWFIWEKDYNEKPTIQWL